jgi:predicted NBD/HSP70 family sugar kinase
LASAVEAVGRPARPARVRRALLAGARRAADAVPGPLRLAVVSAADPVDRTSGRLVQLPDAPFLVGDLAPRDVLAPLVAGPVVVDNDVHWAARAERDAAEDGAALADFAYLYLGEGLGCAVVSDGEVRRGARGVAGEVAHLVVRGDGGRAIRFTELFAELGLRRPGSTAIDADRLLAAVRDDSGSGVRTALGRAVGDVLAALVALTDPALVVVGGSWGPAVLDDVRAELDGQPRPVRLRPTALAGDGPLAGARRQAVRDLGDAVLRRITG